VKNNHNVIKCLLAFTRRRYIPANKRVLVLQTSVMLVTLVVHVIRFTAVIGARSSPAEWVGIRVKNVTRDADGAAAEDIPRHDVTER